MFSHFFSISCKRTYDLLPRQRRYFASNKESTGSPINDLFWQGQNTQGLRLANKRWSNEILCFSSTLSYTVW